MSLQDHLKIASSELMKAADLAKQEINSLRNDESNLEKKISQDISRLTQQIQHREQEVQANDDPTLRSQGQTAINYLVRQVADAKNQLNQEKQLIQDAIRERENIASTLNQQAKSIG